MSLRAKQVIAEAMFVPQGFPEIQQQKLRKIKAEDLLRKLRNAGFIVIKTTLVEELVGDLEAFVAAQHVPYDQYQVLEARMKPIVRARVVIAGVGSDDG